MNQPRKSDRGAGGNQQPGAYGAAYSQAGAVGLPAQLAGAQATGQPVAGVQPGPLLPANPVPLVPRAMLMPGAGQPIRAANGLVVDQMDPGQVLEAPFYLPLYKEAVVNGVRVPKATPLNDPASVQLDNQYTPTGPFGDFTIHGWWAWLCVPNPDPATRGAYPLYFVEPDGGAFSAELPLGPGAPQFRGAMEGNLFEYTMQLSVNTITPINDCHSHTNFMLNPLSAGPVRVPPNSQVSMTVVRRKCSRFFPYESAANPGTVWLLTGLFGTVTFIIPPAYRESSCLIPATPLDVMGQDVVAPINPSALNSLAVGDQQVQLRVNKNHPVDGYQLRYAGAEHLFVKARWQVDLGTLSTDWIPARLFKRALTGGVLAAPIRMTAPTSLDITAAQPMLFPDQQPAAGRFSLGTGVYGY